MLGFGELLYFAYGLNDEFKIIYNEYERFLYKI